MGDGFGVALLELDLGDCEAQSRGFPRGYSLAHWRVHVSYSSRVAWQEHTEWQANQF